MAINTEIRLEIEIRFVLSSKSERDALETKIETFISNQAEGSKFINNISRDVNFRTRLIIVANSIQDVSTVRTNIMNALDEMPTVNQFRFQMEEVLAPVIEE